MRMKSHLFFIVKFILDNLLTVRCHERYHGYQGIYYIPIYICATPTGTDLLSGDTCGNIEYNLYMSVCPVTGYFFSHQLPMLA